MKIEMDEEELAQLAQLTDLTNNQVVDLMHAIWLRGFYEGKIDAARKLLDNVGLAASHIFLLGQDDESARRFRQVYAQVQQSIDSMKKEREASIEAEIEARDRIRKVFRSVRKIVVEWERS